MGRRWTDKDIDNLRQMARKLPAPLIAEIIDRTVGAVAFKAQQLKLRLPSRQEFSTIDPGARMQTISPKTRNDQSA